MHVLLTNTELTPINLFSTIQCVLLSVLPDVFPQKCLVFSLNMFKFCHALEAQSVSNSPQLLQTSEISCLKFPTTGTVLSFIRAGNKVKTFSIQIMGEGRAGGIINSNIYLKGTAKKSGYRINIAVLLRKLQIWNQGRVRRICSVLELELQGARRELNLGFQSLIYSRLCLKCCDWRL